MNFKQKMELCKKIVDDNSIPYTCLHSHSYYSVLDGLSSVKQIVIQAVTMGHGAVAITDHGSISALPVLFKECQTVGIKPIIGVEFYIVDSLEKVKQKRSHLTVLAKTWNGVQSIFKQLTLANKQFYHRPRLSFEQAMQFEECIIMSACAGGFLLRDDYSDRHIQFKSAYGDDYYLEVMPHDFPEQIMVNKRAVELSSDGTDIVATNDSHYISKADRETHEILLAIQTRAKWEDEKRFGKNWPDCDFKSRHEMIVGFEQQGYARRDIEKWLDKTNEVSNKIGVVKPEFKINLSSPLEV